LENKILNPLLHVLRSLAVTNSAVVSFQNYPLSVVERTQAGTAATYKLIGIEVG